MIRCPRCLHENSTGQKLCEECGARIDPAPTEAPIRPRAKPAKLKVQGAPRPSPKSAKVKDALVRDLEKRLADALTAKTEALELLQTRDRELAEAVAQQMATSGVLTVISSSPAAVQPVFEVICRSAVELFGAHAGAVIRFDGHLMHLGAAVSASAEAAERYRQLFPRPASRELMIGQAILDRTVVHVADVQRADSATTMRSRTSHRRLRAATGKSPSGTR